MKRFILFGSSIMLIAVLISAVAFINKKNEIPANHLEVVLRDIEHQSCTFFMACLVVSF